MLKQEFVEQRTHTCHVIPPQWRLDPEGQYYELDLKMCQLRQLQYDFDWGKESGLLPRMASIIDEPSRLVRLDMSLNELTVLERSGLKPYRNMRELNASLNKISNFTGIEVLEHLYTLNLSHNFIDKIENLVPSASLVELNLSMNELTDLSYMPSLINLEVLIVNNNKIRSLDGVQSLARLRELHAQRNNLEDVVPITSCFHIQVLNIAHNQISSLPNTLDILSQLRRLEVLNLHGNPVEADPMYITDIMRSTNVMTLDNISIRPLPKPVDMDREKVTENYTDKHVQNIDNLKEAARQAFEERMRDSKIKMADQIGFLQKRIILLQNEYQEYESSLRNDLDSCLRYLDNLSHKEIGSFDGHAMRDSMGTPAPKPWHRSHHRSRAERDKTDYTQVKQTDQLLKFASLELKK